MPRCDLRESEALPFERARAKVLDEDVGVRDEPIEHGAPVRMLEVERDALLVAIDAQVVRALALDERRSPRSRVVAAFGMLDLDYARTHVGREHRAVRP